MGESAESTLAWPPRREDLERLYVVEHLSASKIAQRYGLKYASPKTAESTILYQLKRAGITRRDCAEHVRKVTEEMADEWVRRYQAGESLKQIAGDRVDAVTVFNHLHKRGLELRDKVEAQIQAVTKYQRPLFQGCWSDAAYLAGFAKGDLFVTTHGRAVRAKTSTTHPAMSELFHTLFDKFGHVREYPRRNELTGYEWSLECDMDSSMAFLKGGALIDEFLADPNTFVEFLSGFLDAEGSVYFHKKSLRGGFEVGITNTDGLLLEKIAARLRERGFSPKVRLSHQQPDRGVKNGGDSIWRLSLWRWDEMQELLRSLKARHPEKVDKIRIALNLEYRPSTQNREKVISDWNSLKVKIEQDRRVYIYNAEIALDRKKRPETSFI